MVSKVAVIAIVGIVAIPILLGYALNLNEVTETDYKTAGDSVNVTPLLQNDVMYTYANADIYQLNTKFYIGSNTKVIPLYNNLTTTKSSYPLTETTYDDHTFASYDQSLDYDLFYEQFDYDTATSQLQAQIYGMSGGTEQLLHTVTTIHFIQYNKSDGTYRYGYYNSSGSISSNTGTAQLTRVVLTTISGTADVYLAYSSTSSYVDFSAGFTFRYGPSISLPGENYQNLTISTPTYTKSALITIDLSSITEDSYAFQVGYCYVEKTTTDGVVKWMVKPRASVTQQVIEPAELYYDQTSTNNTYQLKYWTEDQPIPGAPASQAYTRHLEFRYVGAWPSLIGEANYYNITDVQYKVSSPLFSGIPIGGSYAAYSPTMRVDAAEYRAMEYQIINDRTYSPADFKTNPSTTIDNVQIYGSSLDFGGNTYTVSKGNITLGTHQIPVKGLVLSSVPNGNGEYDNKIGDTVISTTAAPSAITFNGKWSASISTVAQEQYQYTKTEWIAGGFAWNGMDDNFLMVGLITSLGAFIALGIYARRSRASVWPLMLVCGGAAALFFIML